MTEAMEKLIVTRKIVHCKDPLQERTHPDKPTMLLRMREDKAGKLPNPVACRIDKTVQLSMT